MNQARDYDSQGDDAPIIEPAVIEQTPLETALWDEATKPLLQGESAEDWQKDAEAWKEDAEKGDESAIEAIRASHARERWKPWMWRFLSNLRQMQGVFTLACRATGISGTTAHKARACKYFDAAVTESMSAAIDRVEAALHVSAVIGDIKPIYQGGICVGHERRKDTRAAEALLKAKRPGEYRSDGGNQVAISLALPTADAVAEAMARLTAPEVPAIECGTLQNATISDASA